ncbi:MAG TPA: SulP family inorganic anion transporter [Gaiellaceae bacterium]|nr:SulP family inorganic anion transporter [Gaiellaceae bacterium]
MSPTRTDTTQDSYERQPTFRAAREEPLLTRTIPVAGEIPNYRAPSARRDAVAGLTVAALAIPSAMAYAEVAGVSPVNGLYALLLPVVAYAFLGSSRQLAVGPEGSIATLVAAAILPLAVAGSPNAAELAAMLAILVAICFAAAWALRLGWIADYFSRPVLVGYIHGVAVVLVVGQLGKLLGLSIDAKDPLPQLWEVIRELGSVSGTTFAVSVASLAALFGLRLLMPKLPAALLIVVAAIGLSWAVDFAAHGIAVVGPIPAGLPSFDVPTPGFADIVHLLPAALGIFLVCFADEILTARSFAGKHNQNVRGSQELLAMGAANAAAGFTQGFSVGASGSRTAVNDDMGARSQIAGLFAASAVAVILLFLTEPVQYLPKAVLGAVIVFAAVGLIEPQAWRALAAVDPVEVAIAAVTTGCVIFFGVLDALVVAVGLSMVDTVRRSARPHDAVLGWVERLGRYADVSLHPSARVTPGVVVYRLDDRLFFANARYFKGRVREAIRAAPGSVHWLVLDADAMTHVDATGMDALVDVTEGLRRDEIALVMARLRTRMEKQLEDAGALDVIGPDHLYPTVRAAVDACARPNGGS